MRILAGSTAAGYPMVMLGRSRSRYVHRLVVEAFVGPIPDHIVVRHLDGNKMNARMENLTIGTRAENELDKRLHGTSIAGERNPNAKLTWEAARSIRASGEFYRVLAARYGVGIACIEDVRSGKTWKETY